MNDMSDGWVRALVDTATSMEHDGTFAGYTEMFQKINNAHKILRKEMHEA